MTPHGTRTRYKNHGCRCDECRAAQAAYMRDLRRRRSADLAAGRIEITHGTTTAYRQYGCKCDPCREAAVASFREYRHRTGWTRRKATA